MNETRRMNQGYNAMKMSIVNWNVEWATPGSRRTPEIRRRIDGHGPDVVCLTETHTDLMSPGGHVIYSQPDTVYGVRENMRKVMLWSHEPWKQVDGVGHSSMPPGRYVTGVTRTPVGEVTVIGICIPWHMSRAETKRGPERKSPWEDHARYLECLTEVLKGVKGRPLMVVGDFNQRTGQGKFVPPTRQSALLDAMPEDLTIATSALGYRGSRVIDHMALSDELTAESLSVIGNMAGENGLSDHCGVGAILSVQGVSP